MIILFVMQFLVFGAGWLKQLNFEMGGGKLISKFQRCFSKWNILICILDYKAKTRNILVCSEFISMENLEKAR